MTMSSTLQHDGLVVGSPKEEKKVEDRGERRFHRQTALLYESVRRETFSNWPLSFLDPDKLAAAGFFYLRTDDHVQCVFCQGIVGYWDPNDDPPTEHKKHFPNCPLVAGVATGNVPREKPDSETGKVYKLLDDYHKYRVANTRPQVSTTYQKDSLSIPETNKVAFPALNTIQSRTQTFTRWPKDIGVSIDALTEAGFFSTGLSDWVQCFHCGGGLHTWQKGDDPWVEHARFFPYCPFVRMQRGEEVVLRCWKENPAPCATARPITLTPEESDLLLHHPIAKRAIEMGLSPASMKGALKQRVESTGVICRTVTEAMELVFDYEEEQRRNNNAKNNSHDGLVITEENRDNAPTEPMTVQDSFFPKDTSAITYNLEQIPKQLELLAEVKLLQRQVQLEEKRLLCRQCGERRVAVVFQPCSHLHLCSECARPRDTCSSCGTIVRGTLRPIIG
ncbi:baculoviral IAP repeat-containing protein 7-B-like isoform X2 [Penaeus japonicus]|uniref:baculoviral IAP repeat-containing protein 7-B-like isoform X2 n=1 Tax=Penaeus japonicus TaxID=27405 RepID=UPI001C711CB0|nr:baculoviral IAP repeat-containing protein 7-B-like isoform X2 [Penaeus japonicus]